MAPPLAAKLSFTSSPDGKALVHIDAAHDYASVSEDIRAWWPLLRPGGTLLGDDFTASYLSVVRAACDFARENRLVLHSNLSPSERAGKWWVTKPRDEV